MRTPSTRINAAGGLLDDAPGWIRAVLAAAEGAFLSVALVCFPVILVWLLSAGVSVDAWGAVQLGLAMWLLGHGAAVTVQIGTLTLVPLLLTVVVVLVGTWSAQRLTTRLSRSPGRRLARLGGLRLDVAIEGVAFVGAYSVLGLIGSLAARSATLQPDLWGAARGFLLVGLGSYLLGLRAEFRGDLGTVAPGWSLRDRLPGWLWEGLRGGLRALGLLLAAGLVVVLGVLLVRLGRVNTLYDDLSPGAFGGVMLTLGQLMYLPNVVVWAISWLAGPGFGVGVGSTITLTQSTPGLLPLIPFLGVLPEPGPLPGALRLLSVVPVCVGVELGRRALDGRALIGALDELIDGALSALSGAFLSALGAGLLGVLSGGALGAGRLAEVGAPALMLAAMVGGELASGAALWFGVQWLLERRAVPPQTRPSQPPRVAPDASAGQPADPGQTEPAATRATDPALDDRRPL